MSATTRTAVRTAIAEAVERGWWRGEGAPVWLAPARGGMADGATAGATFVAEVGTALAETGATVTGLVCPWAEHGSPAVGSGRTDAAIAAWRDLAHEHGWRVVDLATEPVLRSVTPLTWPPVDLPALALTPHRLVTLAPLVLDPFAGLRGVSAVQAGLLRPRSEAHGEAFAAERMSGALRLWPADLCLLDARRVVVHREMKLAREVQALADGPLLVGRDPREVDAHAAALTGLARRQVPLLRGWRGRGDGADVAVLGPREALRGAAPPPSPAVYGRRAALAGRRVGGRLERVAWWLERRIDLPRVIDFLRRARGLPG